MKSKLKNQTTDPSQLPKPTRCQDCDEDCWDVPNKLRCWLGGTSHCGGYYTEPAVGYCPWLMPGIPFPPKALGKK